MTRTLSRSSRGTVAAVVVLLAVAAGCFRYADQAAPGRKTEERLEAAWAGGKAPHWRNVTRVWLPRAAFINGWLALAAAALVPWARRPLAAAGPAGGSTAAATPAAAPVDTPRVRRLGWCGLALLAGVAAWSTAPRLGQSLWGDEARTLREFIVGQFHTDASGVRTFDEATWGDAFFNFRTPNNHVLYSLAARASHQWLARPPVQAGDAYFSELAMRLPAWLAGIGAVFSVAGLGAVLGWRRAGWLAAALLVLHPGFVRYAAEARGYSFLFAFGPLLVVALARGVQTGRWRWWALAGALDFALLYTWPLCLYFVAVANLGAVAALVFGRGRGPRDRATLILRWGLTALAAAAVWLQLFLPNVIQLRFWLRGASAKGAAGDGGWIDALSSWLTGRVWHEADAGNPLLTPWVRTWESHAWLVVLAGGFLLAALVAGVLAAWRRTPGFRPWLPALLVPPLLILGQAALSGSVLYPWYLMAAVPGMLLLLAIGLETAAVRLTGSAGGQAAVLGAGVAVFGLMGGAARDHLRHHPIEPNREAALLVQPVINPHHPDYQRTVLTGGFLMRNTIYDPGVREFQTVAELRALMEEAGRTGRDFAVIYGQQELARQSFPEIMAVLDDPSVFTPVATLPGQEAYSTRHIVRHASAR
jgi:hypothetical protein